MEECDVRINPTFELSLLLDAAKYQNALSVSCNLVALSDDDDEYIDQSMASKGITVTYRGSQYKKKVKVIANQSLLLGDNEYDPDRLIRKLEKRILEYFDRQFQIDDFTLSGLVLTADIDVQSRNNVANYLKALRRVGRVKGFTPAEYECFEDDSGFCLEGNSNGIDFMIYDLEEALAGQLRRGDAKRGAAKSMIENVAGILRSEVHLTKPKAMRAYTTDAAASIQITALSAKCRKIFFDTVTRIIPYGSFHKKADAVAIIRRDVKDLVLKRKMLYLLALIPEKKSLLLAQKALNYRRIDDVMEMFAAIELSPVTLSKRHAVKRLDNLYAYLLNGQ
jgi:hypothetical protein